MEPSQGTSRIFIQGLPAYADEKRIKDLFGERGDVTDVKVMRTKAGHSRQFGFVGFTTVEQARDCIQYFNNSYIDTSRIQVKFAESAQSQNIERPWSKYSAGSSQYIKRKREEEPPKKLKAREAMKLKKAKYKANDDAEDDPELAEFLEVMRPRSKTALWSNDGAQPTAKVPAAVAKGKSAREEGADSDDEMYQEVDTTKNAQAATQSVDENKSKGKKSKRKAKKAKTDPEDAIEEEGAEKDAVVENEDISDLEYLKSRMKAKGDIQAAEHSTDEASSDEEEGTDASSRSEQGEDSSEGSETTGITGNPEGDEKGMLDERRGSHNHAGPSAEGDPPSISETGRLFLRNLPYQATEADISELFQNYGELSEVHLVIDRASGKSKGFALVQFLEGADAEAAASALDGSVFQGRLLHILPAKPLPQTKVSQAEEADNVDDSQEGDYKKVKAGKTKAETGNRQAWNTLFMRQDTVAEAVAAHFNISKAELLNRDAADLPVRMALGEAHVVTMTKKGLEEGGVDIAALQQAASASGKASSKSAGIERSGNAILIKNLPYTATESELLEMFNKFGPVSRLVLPETKTMAIIQFHGDADARKAFKGLAFRKFQAVPLFLEWAPKNIFRADAAFLNTNMAVPERIRVSENLDALVDTEESATESSTIYVKNISWSTTDQTLLKHFDPVISAAGGTVRAAKVAKRKDPKSGKMLSAGYGFVECSSETMAKLAIKKLQNSLLDGHKLALQLSMKKALDTQTGAKSVEEKATAKATKVVVRNVAFEAKSQDVRAVFQPFGQVRSVRVPRKFDGSHRGFAFVDFMSHKEAVGAMEAVNGVHLYGRRLVCEWASLEEGLDELRAKTAVQFDQK